MDRIYVQSLFIFIFIGLCFPNTLWPLHQQDVWNEFKVLRKCSTLRASLNLLWFPWLRGNLQMMCVPVCMFCVAQIEKLPLENNTNPLEIPKNMDMNISLVSLINWLGSGDYRSKVMITVACWTNFYPRLDFYRQRHWFKKQPFKNFCQYFLSFL